MKGFEIINPGFQSSFQDGGRLGHQQKGIPIGGAMDHESMLLANALVGKDKGAVLEMPLMGVQIKFAKPMMIAISGGQMGPMVNNISMPMYQSFRVKAGDILSFKGLQSGFRTYIAFSDELVLDMAFASKSTYTKAHMGGYKGRCLKAGDVVEVIEKKLPKRMKVEQANRDGIIRVMLTYEDDQFKNTDTLFDQAYTLSQDMDRMGMRLEGDKIEHKGSADIISSPIVPGTIQIPQSGQPIIMLRDAQTIGGYTRIGAVLSCDLDKLAQMKAGDRVKFELVSHEEGRQLKRMWLKKIHSIQTIDLSNSKSFNVKVNGRNYAVEVEAL